MTVYNANDFNRVFRETRLGVGVTGQAVTIKLDRIKPRRCRTLTHVTVENRTNDYPKCRIGIERAGRNHYLDELTVIVADELAVSRSDILLGEGDVFFAELTGTTTGDNLVMTCIGWELDL